MLGRHGFGDHVLQPFVAPFERRRSLANSLFELLARGLQRVLRSASRSTDRGQQRGQRREDHEARKLRGVELERIERRREEVVESERGQHPGQQRRPQPAHPPGHQHAEVQQLSARQGDGSQPQAGAGGDRDAQHSDRVSNQRVPRDVALHQTPCDRGRRPFITSTVTPT